MAILTKKFSEFATASLNATNKTVGLSAGANAMFSVPLTWTTATRPTTPTNALLGYNTDLTQYEFFDEVLGDWTQLEDSGDFADLLALLASHTVGEGASLIGLQGAGTVQDLTLPLYLVESASSLLTNEKVLTAGSGVTFTSAAGTLTIDATGLGGTVTSVGSGTGITASPNPIIGAGTINLAAIATLTGLVNTTAGPLAPSATTLTAWIDAALGSTQGDILYRDAASWTVLAPSTSGKVLQTRGAAANPAYSTPTYPSASGTAGQLIRADGTNNLYSTSTFADTYLINTIPFAGTANVIAGATLTSIIDAAIGGAWGDILYRGTAAWSVLVAGTSGEFLRTNGPGADPSWEPEAGTGSVTSVGSGTGLTGGAITTTGTLSFAAIAAHSLWANVTGGSAVPTEVLTSTFLQTINVQTFGTPGAATFTPTTGAKYFIIEGWGAGGGGGGAAGAAGQLGVGGGGAGGGYFWKLFNATELGADAAISIGTGGAAGAAGNNNGSAGTDTTFNPAGTGATLTATGGAAGQGSASSATQTNANGGTPGGVGTNGDVNVRGSQGFPGVVILGSGGFGYGGMGGGTYGNPTNVVAGLSGSLDGQNPGQGGTGALSGAGADTEAGDGANGYCRVIEFIAV